MNNIFTNSFAPTASLSGTVGVAFGETPASDTQSSSKGSSKPLIGILDESMMKLLIEHGLTSDVMAFFDLAGWAITHAYNPITGKPILSAYKAVISKLVDIKNSKDTFQKAYEEVKKKEGLDEIAIDTNGQVYIYNNKDGLTTKSLSKIVEGEDVILTNGDLANIRQKNPQFAFREDITTTVANGIGTSLITKYLNDLVKHLGTTTKEVALEVPINVSEGASLLAKLLKGVERTEQMTKDLIDLCLEALKWISSMLPKNMATLLSYRSKLSNVSESDLLISWLGIQMDSTVKLEKSLKGIGSKDGSSGAKDTSDKMPVALLWLYGYGERRGVTILKGTKDAMAIQTNVMPILGKSGNIGITTLQDISDSLFGGVLNVASAVIADQVIPFSNLQDVVVDGNSLYKMDLPYDVGAFVNSGVLKPDLKWLPKIQEAERQVTKLKCWDDPSKINAIYESLDLPVKYLDGTKELTAQYKTFGVLNAYSTNEVFGDDEFDIDRDYAKEILNESTITNVYNIINKGVSENSTKSYSKPGWLFGGGNHVYESVVFIPVRKDYFDAVAGSGQLPTVNDAISIEGLLQQLSRLSRANVGEKP